MINCKITCILGLGLVAANLYTMMTPEEEVNQIRKMLDKEAVEAYERIIMERMKIYVQGMVLGLVLAYVIFNSTRNIIISQTCRICLFVLVTLSVNMIYYKLMPKSEWMLSYLKTPEQNKEWLRIYQTMQGRFHLGFLVGAAGSAIFCKGLCG
jgi:uncharacterized protein YacL